MSSLKFRAWDIERNTYEHEELLLAPNGDILTSRWQELCEPESEYVIEQYTGLKDKNGKEIYEGDIVRTKSPDRANFNAGAIEMVQQLYLIMNSAHYRDPEISHCEPLGYYCDTELEVIGNIHENSELLGD